MLVMDDVPDGKDYLTSTAGGAYVGRLSPIPSPMGCGREAEVRAPSRQQLPAITSGPTWSHFASTISAPTDDEPRAILCNVGREHRAQPEAARAASRRPRRSVRRHFEQKRDAAIIQIPVGCGKTGLIDDLSFSRSPTSPSRDRANNERYARESPTRWRSETRSSSSARPHVLQVVHERSRSSPSSTAPNATSTTAPRARYVITNIQQLASSADRWLPQFPPNLSTT